MADAGYKCIEVAKENGSRANLNQVVTVPEDLRKSLAIHQGAMAYFEGLSKSAEI